MKKIVGELLKNKNPEKNLQEYYGRFMEINNQYAMIHLAMDYYTYYVSVSEDGGMIAPGYQDTVNQINQSIAHYFDGSDLGEDIQSLEQLRGQIIEKVKDMTCFIDMYNVYEHAFNRVEYKFREDDYPEGYSDEDYTRQIMRFILEDEDRMTINYKIQDVVGQLPVRLTKNKFFEMLSDGMSVYEGGTKESLNSFLYIIRTRSMLDNTETMAVNYPYLSEAFEQLQKTEFKHMELSDYQDMKKHLSDITAYIDSEMDSCMMIQEILNNLLLVLYTKEYEKKNQVTESCNTIVKETNLLFMDKFSSKSLEEIEDMFVLLEGEQERLYPMISSYDITDQIQETYSELIQRLGLEEQYHVVYKLPKLNSDSMFADMEKKENLEPVDESYLKEQKEKVIEEYKALFAENDRMINRAVMSAVLSELPIFFNNISELQDYIYDTLSICMDKVEKLACIELILSLIHI